MNDILVITVKMLANQKQMNSITNYIRESMKTGLVVLPAYCEAVVVPEGTEVRVENAHGSTGHWINSYPDVEPNPMFGYGICSNCGFEQSLSNKLKYCPNCGIKMDEDDNLDERTVFCEWIRRKKYGI